MAVQRPHNADTGKHRPAATFSHQDQRLHRGLPFRRGVLFLRQTSDVLAGIAQCLQRATVNLDRFFEKPPPAPKLSFFPLHPGCGGRSNGMFDLVS